MARVAAAVAVMLSVLAASFLIFADTYSGQSCSADSSGVSQCIDTSETLIEENGSWILLLVAIPVCLAVCQFLLISTGGPVLIKALVAAAFLGACLVAITSLGFFFLPAALVSALAVALDRRQRDSQPA